MRENAKILQFLLNDQYANAMPVCHIAELHVMLLIYIRRNYLLSVSIVIYGFSEINICYSVIK